MRVQSCRKGADLENETLYLYLCKIVVFLLSMLTPNKH
jgi:hypothetical protein